MSTQMSLLSLLLNSSLMVKFVMLALLFCSVISWTYIVQRWSYYLLAENKINEFDSQVDNYTNLHLLYNRLSLRQENLSPLEMIFIEGYQEFLELRDCRANPESQLEGVKRRINVALTQSERGLDQNLSFLATVQSMSPYIGLFGTVWGIMQSFRQLGAVQQASLSMVAPGIAEALIATAMGLIAAIPAGIAYNRFVSKSNSILNRYDLFAEKVLAMIHRQVYSG
jgi:biopolymer transport protein TolQ